MPGGGKKISDHRKKTTNPHASVYDQLAAKMYAKGVNDVEIAATMGVTKQAIAKWRRNHGNLPANRSRGQRGAGKKVRPDRMEAVGKVVTALLREPIGTARQLAAIAWPPEDEDNDPKKLKRAVERVRRVLHDLHKDPSLAGAKTAKLTAIMDERKRAVEEMTIARLEAAAAKAAKRVEVESIREERLRRSPVRYMLKRILYYEEAAKALRKVVTKQRLAGNREMALYFLPTDKDQVPVGLPVKHFAPGVAGSIMDDKEAEGRANRELAIQCATTNLASFPVEDGIELLRAAKAVRKAQKAGKGVAGAKVLLNFYAARAVEHLGWADPDLPAMQLVESPGARVCRIENTIENAQRWAEEPVNLGMQSERWPLSFNRQKKIAKVYHEPLESLSLEARDDQVFRKAKYEVGVEQHDSPGGGYYTVSACYVYNGRSRVIAQMLTVMPPKVGDILPDIMQHWEQVGEPGEKPYIAINE